MKLCPTCGAEWSDDNKFCPKDGTTLRGAQAGQLIGSVIADRYHILKKLGEGGMGAVYLGEHVKMGRKSAIKVMTQAMAHDADAIARFNREAANAARINHPNVCAIYDFGETPDGTIYLAMEFIEGVALSDLLRAEGALPLSRAARLLEQTGHALQAAHDLGIVHRDLKPDNIMVAKHRDGTDIVKVVDFGIAKAMGGEEGQKVTKTGLVVGTPEYMSPEQLSGDALDGRSDIYSLGLVCFRMLTGRLPFEADTAQEMMIKRLTDEPLRLADAAPGVPFPPGLQAVLDRALQRMPGDRYDSAAAFVRDVTATLRDAAATGAAGAGAATQLIDAQEEGADTQLARTRTSKAVKEPATPTTPQPMTVPVGKAPRRGRSAGALAATIGVLVIGGGTAALIMANRGPGRTADGVPVDTNVTGTTAPDSGGGDAARRPQQQVASGDGTTGTAPEGSPPPERGEHPAPDTARVNADLARILEQVDSVAVRAQARERAQGYYDDARLPASLRAAAAAAVAQAYLAEDRMDETCRWYGMAKALNPTNGTYVKTLNLLGCAP